VVVSTGFATAPLFVDEAPETTGRVTALNPVEPVFGSIDDYQGTIETPFSGHSGDMPPLLVSQHGRAGCAHGWRSNLPTDRRTTW
jgi:hypothetical protein